MKQLEYEARVKELLEMQMEAIKNCKTIEEQQNTVVAYAIAMNNLTAAYMNSMR